MMLIVLGGNLSTIQKNAQALVVTSTEIGLTVNSGKTKHITMSLDQYAGEITVYWHFKHLETTQTNQISIHEELRTDWSQGIIVIVWRRIFCLRVYYQKIKRLRYTEQ
jgi:hypothetical protein